jgi:hypothetical protein
MKCKYVLLALLVLIASNTFALEHGKYGLGIMLGEPTGITDKYFFNEESAIDFGAGWQITDTKNFQIYGDYLYHLNYILDVSEGTFPLFFGAGLRYVIREDDDDGIGIRLPVGLEYIVQHMPIRIFVELVPVLDLTSDTEFDLDGGVGVRYFF